MDGMVGLLVGLSGDGATLAVRLLCLCSFVVLEAVIHWLTLVDCLFLVLSAD